MSDLQQSAEQITPSGEPVEQSPARTSGVKRFVLIAVLLLVVFVGGGLAWAYRMNNRAAMTPDELVRACDEAMERGAAWVENNTQRFGRTGDLNVALFYMMQDMDALHATPIFHEAVEQFKRMPLQPSFWKKMIEPDRPVSAGQMANHLMDYATDYRWMAYSLGPDAVELPAKDMKFLFDPEASGKRRLVHQVWALWHLRRIHGEDRVSQSLLDRLCERIASECAYDVRAYDLYFERVAFLLMAGRPDLVKQRWLERIVQNQQPDGGWSDKWMGMTSSAEFGTIEGSNEHSTLLALWALYQARYRHAGEFGM